MIRPDPKLSLEEQSEAFLLRAVIWAEARGESALGKLAVAWVVSNRAVRRDTSLKHEILRPWQFSSFNKNDPNRPMLLHAHITDSVQWRICDAIAELFEAQATIDPTLGSTHYLRRDVLAVQPDWSLEENGWDKTVQIGNHEFGRAL